MRGKAGSASGGDIHVRGRKVSIKNTTGYRLCAFLDADTPLEIFRRLIVGSEGTLAFVAEAVFESVPLGRHTTLALALFDGIDAAVAAVEPLVAAGASATELMVAPTLIAAAWNMPGTPERWKELPPESAALLIEFRAEGREELDGPEAAAIEILSAAELLDPPRFTRDPAEVEMLWHVREGMQGLLAAMFLLAAPKLAHRLPSAGWGMHLLDPASIRLIEREDFPAA